jgi:hypothetical protein
MLSRAAVTTVNQGFPCARRVCVVFPHVHRLTHDGKHEVNAKGGKADDGKAAKTRLQRPDPFVDITISVSIDRAETVEDASVAVFTDATKSPKHGARCTAYVVTVAADGCVWFVSLRYKAFRTLHVTLTDKPYSVKVRCNHGACGLWQCALCG